jgi:arylsulfatase A-like enzyme
MLRASPLLRAALAALLALVATGCGRRLAPTRGIIVVSLDTLRADRLGCYGNARDTSPFLDRLAARGVRFERAQSLYPSTLTSHMSIFTSLYPREHAVFPPDGRLAATIPTLPEVFQRAGYRTAGFTEAGQVKGLYGFARGFDVFDDSVEHRADDVERTLGRGLDFLRSLAPGERYFLFLHSYAIHAPYNPPPPYDRLFWSEEPPTVFAPTGPNFLRFNSYRGTLPPGAVDYFLALYDGSIRYVDDRLREFYGQIEALGLADDLTLVVTSDHGEEFLEHGQLSHGQIYDETLHVPLLLLHPQLREPRQVAHLVQLIDLAPTLYDLAAIAPPDVSGSSLVPLLAGERGEPRGWAYAEVETPAGPARTLYREAPSRLLQLVHTRIDISRPSERTTEFDIGPAALELAVAPFRGEPRRLEVRVDGVLQQSLALAPDAATRLLLPAAPAARRRRIRLEADTCTPRSRRHAHRNCFSFQLTAPHDFDRLELFELSSDPRGARDLFDRHADVGQQMLQALRALRWAARGAGGRIELDEEAVRQLEALGYL